MLRVDSLFTVDIHVTVKVPLTIYMYIRTVDIIVTVKKGSIDPIHVYTYLLWIQL